MELILVSYFVSKVTVVTVFIYFQLQFLHHKSHIDCPETEPKISRYEADKEPPEP
jgi:hypothetical protein